MLRAAGIPIALGGDGPASNDSLDMVAEMKAGVLLQRVHRLDALALSAADVFTMATEGGARVLGLGDLGRLEPGYLADVIGVRAVWRVGPPRRAGFGIGGHVGWRSPTRTTRPPTSAQVGIPQGGAMR